LQDEDRRNNFFVAMKTKCFAALLAGVFLTASSLIADQPSAIHGTVTGPNGKPMMADVQLDTIPSKQPLLRKTDRAGKYEFSNLKPGAYKLTVLSGSKLLGFLEGVQLNGTRKIDFEITPAVAGQSAKARHLVWVPSSTGSHTAGRWVDVSDQSLPAGTFNVESLRPEVIRDIQSRQVVGGR
jgi:hypothetical protein